MLSIVICQAIEALQLLHYRNLTHREHIWDEPKPALMQFDVYSCGEFDVKEICDKIKEEFNVKKIEYKYLNRETGLVDI